MNCQHCSQPIQAIRAYAFSLPAGVCDTTAAAPDGTIAIWAHEDDSLVCTPTGWTWDRSIGATATTLTFAAPAVTA